MKSLFNFYTPWKRQKPMVFWRFQGYKMEHWLNPFMYNVIKWPNILSKSCGVNTNGLMFKVNYKTQQYPGSVLRKALWKFFAKFTGKTCIGVSSIKKNPARALPLNFAKILRKSKFCKNVKKIFFKKNIFAWLLLKNRTISTNLVFLLLTLNI